MTRKVDDYLAQQVNYGGEWVTIGDLIERLGAEPAMMWLAGYTFSQRVVLAPQGIAA